MKRFFLSHCTTYLKHYEHWKRKLTIILPIFTAHVSAIDIVNKLLTSVELYATLSITTVKKTIMPLFSIGGLVVYQKHIFFLTGNIRHHTI